MVRVVKLGGSLLDLPDLASRLRRFIDSQCDSRALLIVVGGGKIVDAVRDYDSIHSIHPITSHWLSVDLMHSTAMLLQALLPELPLLADTCELSSFVWAETKGAETIAVVDSVVKKVAIVSPLCFYSRSCNAQVLPIGWQTTSDSISAFLATMLRADELILLKSTDGSKADGQDIQDQQIHHEQSLVDKAFQSVVPDWLKVRIVNLRAD